MKEILLDSDIISYYMKKRPEVVAKFDNYIKKYGYIYISRISVIEILGGLQIKNAKKQINKFKKFISNHKILDTSESSAEISAKIFADLYKKGKHSGNYDILIAGIAIANNLTLITNNIKDYENIENLSIDNWVNFTSFLN